jgi:hypothetical protein
MRIGEARSEKPLRLSSRSSSFDSDAQRPLLEAQLEIDDLLDLRKEPGVDLGVRVDFLERHADAERVGDVPQPLGARVRELVADRVRVDRLEVEAVHARLQAAQRLLQRLLERAADGHHLAHRLHLRREAVVRLLELLEGEARHLGDHVVDRRLERRRSRAARDLVLQLVERDSRPRAWRRPWRSEIRSPSTPAPSSATRAGSSR